MKEPQDCYVLEIGKGFGLWHWRIRQVKPCPGMTTINPCRPIEGRALSRRGATQRGRRALKRRGREFFEIEWRPLGEEQP